MKFSKSKCLPTTTQQSNNINKKFQLLHSQQSYNYLWQLLHHFYSRVHVLMWKNVRVTSQWLLIKLYHQCDEIYYRVKQPTQCSKIHVVMFLVGNCMMDKHLLIFGKQEKSVSVEFCGANEMQSDHKNVKQGSLHWQAERRQLPLSPPPDWHTHRL